MRDVRCLINNEACDKELVEYPVFSVSVEAISPFFFIRGFAHSLAFLF